jgi:hypothetical protein
MRRAAILVLVLSFSLCAVAKSGGSHSSHGSRSHSSKSPASKKSFSRSSHTHAYRKNYAAPGYALHSSVQRDAHGRIKRSAAAKNAFKRQHPCPATGRSSGACPRIRDRPREIAGMRRCGRALEHAMANGCCREGDGQDGAVLPITTIPKLDIG